jgi:hypothetical protein
MALHCFYDDSHWLLACALFISLSGYVLVSVVASGIWFRAQVGLMFGLLMYAVISTLWPTVWPTGGSASVSSIFAFTAILLVALSVVTDIGMLFVSLFLMAPVVAHNGDVLGVWLQQTLWSGAPAWLGIVVFVLLCLLVVGVLAWSGVFTGIGLVCKVVVSSILVFVAARMAWIEFHPAAPEGALGEDVNDASMCCTMSIAMPGDAESRCPFGLESVGFNALLVSLLIVGGMMAWKFNKAAFLSLFNCCRGPCCASCRKTQPPLSPTQTAPESTYTPVSRAWPLNDEHEHEHEHTRTPPSVRAGARPTTQKYTRL